MTEESKKEEEKSKKEEVENKKEEAENKKETPENEKETEKSEKRVGEWMLKPCEWYSEEYKDCKCTRARFNQYFIYGELLNCKQWKIDAENCAKWKSKNDDEAYNALLASEKARRLKRLAPHYGNDVWTKRDKPPESWNAPLPEWMQKQNEGTYLDIKQKGLESGQPNDLDLKLPFCVIM